MNLSNVNDAASSLNGAYFVTGTDTEIGKTTTTAQLVNELVEAADDRDRGEDRDVVHGVQGARGLEPPGAPREQDRRDGEDREVQEDPHVERAVRRGERRGGHQARQGDGGDPRGDERADPLHDPPAEEVLLAGCLERGGEERQADEPQPRRGPLARAALVAAQELREGRAEPEHDAPHERRDERADRGPPPPEPAGDRADDARSLPGDDPRREHDDRDEPREQEVRQGEDDRVGLVLAPRVPRRLVARGDAGGQGREEEDDEEDDHEDEEEADEHHRRHERLDPVVERAAQGVLVLHRGGRSGTVGPTRRQRVGGRVRRRVGGRTGRDDRRAGRGRRVRRHRHAEHSARG